MRGLLVVAFALLSVACQQQRKPAISDAEFQEIRASHPGMKQRCLDDIRYKGITAWQPDEPSCFEMMPAQLWSGLWETGWEWTNFCPDPAKECDWMSKRGTWLTFAKDTYRGPRLPDGIYRIEFVGRRTKVPGNFGHSAGYDHLMVVDKVISIDRIPGEKYVKKF